MVKIFKGIPYTGTLPAVLAGTKAGYLHRYKIYGNIEQTGTPTPENPIYPSECGERTGNLLNTSGAQSGYLKPDGSIVQGHETLMYTDYIPIPENASAVTQTASYRMLAPAMCFYDNAKNYISGETFENVTSKTFTVPNGAKFLRTSYRKSPTYGNTMLNTGSTALTYEPYGYELPLLSGSTPVDIYLGESQTTRQIKKLVLDGTESWYYDARYTRFYASFPDINLFGVRLTPFVCSHYVSCDDGRSIADVPNNAIYSGQQYVYIKTDTYSSVADFKTYLQQQYTNGTPVTVWYILATEETAVVNEPLRKIGDYADTIDSTQTTAQIPTSANSTTISWAGQGLAPSEFDSIAEWVSATPKIYTNGAWTDAQTYTYDDGAWVADN